MEIQRQMQEFQRMQIRDQEQQQQQQEAVYRRKNNEDGLIETSGGYFSPPSYAQNPAPPPQPQPTIPLTNPQVPPMTNFWQGNHNPGGVFPTTTPGLGLPEQPVYMIPSPSPVYHAPPPQPQPQGVMRPVATGQVNQGGYYPPVQRMAAPDTYREQHQPPYNVAQPSQPPVGTKAQQLQQQQPPPPFTSGPPPPQYTAVPPPRQVVGLPDTSAYTQVTYAGGMGKQVYYTEAPPPPHYHGIGLPVTGMNELRTGPDGKLVAMNMAPKVSSQGSDSAV